MPKVVTGCGAQEAHSSLTAATQGGRPSSVLEPHIEENREQRPTEQWIPVGAVRERLLAIRGHRAAFVVRTDGTTGTL
jgi:hypothetical protein